jgi:hypothetical protein
VLFRISVPCNEIYPILLTECYGFGVAKANNFALLPIMRNIKIVSSRVTL